MVSTEWNPHKRTTVRAPDIGASCFPANPSIITRTYPASCEPPATMFSSVLMARSTSYLKYSRPPDNYTTPPFPSLYWPPQDTHSAGSLYYLFDIWRFTLLWTLILYAIFHIGVAAVALSVQLLFSGRPAYWRYLWTIPVSYAVVAGIQAVFAGSFVALIIGAAYISGPFWMSTWIPFIWGWACVLVILISSFSIQGGL
ncbi:integral membrane protein [Grosmannia clavigera kw1407]|uniref:Integral membrane protein n=1 Tax=Grosmannia clavigera (strain kw1407 / UAMH 11150) TaxID=655863 RepID=F0XQ87_GROCL|nr:uncharacterized protein CMQ_7724 [Grosmannia clavigera kw1407]EFX00722.1 integral membrane protein [Grosmannia clavigera kw1407]